MFQSGYNREEVIMYNDKKKVFGYFVFGDKVSEAIEVCDAGFEECAPGHAYGPAVRNYYLIHFVKSGKGVFSVGGNDYALEKNSAFLIRPGVVSYYRADSDDPWHYAWLGIRGSEAERLINATLGDCDVFNVPAELIYELEAVVKTAVDVTDMAYALTGLCYKILGRMRSERAPKPKRPDIVKSATRFIEYNYFRPFDVTRLAEELGMSRAHFTTVFTAAMGVSPYNYLTRFRISKAESLIKSDAGLSVTEVAYSVGFSSIERFSEMFKKYAGVSPLVYKKNLADSTK